jgi:hypothetical protein
MLLHCNTMPASTSHLTPDATAGCLLLLQISLMSYVLFGVVALESVFVSQVGEL